MGQQRIQQASTAIAERNGLSVDLLTAMRAFREEGWQLIGQSEPFVLRHDETNLLPDGTHFPPTGLGRSLLVVPQPDGDIRVFAMLKQKGGMEKVGEGAFKKATWVVDVNTRERKVFLSGKKELGYLAIRDRERNAHLRYAGRPGFSTGPVVKYTHKQTGAEKWGVLVDPAEGGDFDQFVSYWDDNRFHPITDEQRLNRIQILETAYDVAFGLAQMHELGDIHYDIKLANLLRQANGRALISDFSLTREQGAPAFQVGTLAKMALKLQHRA